MAYTLVSLQQFQKLTYGEGKEFKDLNHAELVLPRKTKSLQPTGRLKIQEDVAVKCFTSGSSTPAFGDQVGLSCPAWLICKGHVLQHYSSRICQGTKGAPERSQEKSRDTAKTAIVKHRHRKPPIPELPVVPRFCWRERAPLKTTIKRRLPSNPSFAIKLASYARQPVRLSESQGHSTLHDVHIYIYMHVYIHTS